jgi:hypothetical protein
LVTFLLCERGALSKPVLYLSHAANQLVKRFVEQKMLREITGHARHRRFRYDPYVRLFTDEEEVSTRPGTS